MNPVVQEGEMCAMIYVLNTDQAVEACCGCPITADGLLTLSISGPGAEPGGFRQDSP